MRKLLFALFFLTQFGLVYCQESEEFRPVAKNRLENKFFEIDKVNISQNHAIDNVEIDLKNLKETSLFKYEAYRKEVDNEIQDLNTKINYYILFGTLLLGLIGFLINYFGRSLIKDRVEKLIAKTASEYALLKTNEVIAEHITEEKVATIIKSKGEPAINDLLVDLKTRGSKVIEGIEQKGEKAISSMLATQQKLLSNKDDINTDEEIIQANKITRSREYFALAFSSDDPLIQIELYKNVIELDPNNLNAYNNIGVSYNNAYGYEDAIKYLTSAIEINPEYELAYANRANSYNLQHELEKAIIDVDKAISLNAKLDWSFAVKGNILTKLGKLEEAESVFNKAIAINPKSPEAYVNRGYFFEGTKKYDEAEADYNRAKSLGFLNKAMLYNNFAVLYRRKKDFQKAINYLEKARHEDPDYPNLDGTLALIYADKKDKDNFYKYLISALKKGCPAWNYINDTGFDEYRNEEKLKTILATYKKKYASQ